MFVCSTRNDFCRFTRYFSVSNIAVCFLFDFRQGYWKLCAFFLVCKIDFYSISFVFFHCKLLQMCKRPVGFGFWDIFQYKLWKNPRGKQWILLHCFRLLYKANPSELNALIIIFWKIQCRHLCASVPNTGLVIKSFSMQTGLSLTNMSTRVHRVYTQLE